MSVAPVTESGAESSQGPGNVPGTVPGNVQSNAAWLGEMGRIVADETVSIEAGMAEKQRQQLRLLAKQGEGVKQNQEFAGWSQLVRVQLHEYRRAVESRVEQQKKDLESTGAALQEAMEVVAQQGEDQTKRLRTELGNLGQLRNVLKLEDVHRGIDTVAHSLTDVVRTMQVQNSLVVAQMRDEIRTLQQRLELAERRDRGANGNLSNRGPFERRLQTKIAADEVFSLFLIRISNWKQLLTGLSQEKAQTLVNDVAVRLNQVLGSETFAGRWYDGYFAAIVAAAKRQALEATQEVSQKVSGPYKLSSAPGEKAVIISVRVAVLEHYSGQTADHLLRRVDELIRAYEGGGAS